MLISHQYDVVCLSEILLDSQIETNDNKIDIEGYDPVRVDFPGNKKERCMYVL